MVDVQRSQSDLHVTDIITNRQKQEQEKQDLKNRTVFFQKIQCFSVEMDSMEG